MSKFCIWVCYGFAKVAQWLESTYREIHGGYGPEIFHYLNRYNSAADCSTSLKFVKELIASQPGRETAK